MLRERPPGPLPVKQLEAAEKLIRYFSEESDPVTREIPARQVTAYLRDELGLGVKTITKVKKRMGIKSVPIYDTAGVLQYWAWYLPEDEADALAHYRERFRASALPR